MIGELRIESYELIAKSVKENSEQYQPKIESLTKKIEDVINSIKKAN